MRRRGNIWVWLIGLPVIFGAAAHWGFYYFIKTRLDDAIFQLTPHAIVQYQTLETQLSGKVDVRGIKVLPVGVTEPVTIDAIHVEGPDAFSYLLKRIPFLGLDESGPPPMLDVIIKGIQMDISGERAVELDRYLARSVAAGNAAPRADICQVGGNPSFVQLQSLGMDRLSANARMGYQFIPSARKLYVNMEGEIQGMQRFEMALVLTNVPALDAQKMMGIALSNLKLTYFHAPAFAQNVMDHCAQKRGLTAGQFRLLMIDDFIRELEQNGIRPGSGLKQAIKSYLTTWGTLSLEISPPRPLGMFELMRLPRGELAEKLGLRMMINEGPVADLDFKVLEAVPPMQRKEKPAEKKKKPAPPKIEYVWEYHKVKMSSLPNYLDHKVIIRERDGRTHEGVLYHVGGGRVSIMKRVSGGKFIAHLVDSNIVSVEARVKVERKLPPSTAQQGASKEAKPGNTQAATEQGQ